MESKNKDPEDDGERENSQRFEALRAAIDKGINNGLAKPGVFFRIRSKYLQNRGE